MQLEPVVSEQVAHNRFVGAGRRVDAPEVAEVSSSLVVGGFAQCVALRVISADLAVVVQALPAAHVSGARGTR